MEQVLDTLSYVKKFQGETILIKVGGEIVENPDGLKYLVNDIALLQSLGIYVVLVHGGGAVIKAELDHHDIPSEFVGGLRKTTPEMIDIVEMALVGRVNTKLVRAFNAHGVKAVGHSGADAETFLCRGLSPELGRVGEIMTVNSDLVKDLLYKDLLPLNSYLPVVASIGVGMQGKAYNVNADWAACKLAVSLGVKKLIYLTNAPGILDADKQLISEIDAGGLKALVDSGAATDGMVAKVNTIVEALKSGVLDVHVLDGNQNHVIIEELFTSGGVGTVCRARSELRSPVTEAKL